MKKALAAILAASLLWGCSSEGSTASEDAQVRETVTSYLADFHDGDLKGADEYIASNLSAYRLGDALDAMDEIYESLGLDQESIAALKDALAQMMGALIDSYDIQTVTVEEDTATVDVKITGISMTQLQSVESEDFLEAVDAALADNTEEDQQLQAALDAMIEKIHELSTSEYEATFSLAKEDNTWKIDEISGLMDYQ